MRAPLGGSGACYPMENFKKNSLKCSDGDRENTEVVLIQGVHQRGAESLHQFPRICLWSSPLSADSSRHENKDMGKIGGHTWLSAKQNCLAFGCSASHVIVLRDFAPLPSPCSLYLGELVPPDTALPFSKILDPPLVLGTSLLRFAYDFCRLLVSYVQWRI